MCKIMKMSTKIRDLLIKSLKIKSNKFQKREFSRWREREREREREMFYNLLSYWLTLHTGLPKPLNNRPKKLKPQIRNTYPLW